MAELTTPTKGVTIMTKHFMFPEGPKTSNLTSTCGDEYITVRPEAK